MGTQRLSSSSVVPSGAWGMGAALLQGAELTGMLVYEFMLKSVYVPLFEDNRKILESSCSKLVPHCLMGIFQ